MAFAKKFPTLVESAKLRYAVFFYLYAMQGIPAGFALTALANYLINRGVSAIAIGTFDALIGLPWIIQFIWGPLVDRFQYSTMGLRKQWILIAQSFTIALTACLLLIHDPVIQLKWITIIFMCHSVAASVQDAAVDGTAIAISPAEQMGKLNAFMRLGMLIGIAIGAAGFSVLLHVYGFFYAAFCQTAILLILTITTWFIKIRPGDKLFPVFSSDQKELLQQDAKLPQNPSVKWLFKQLYAGIVAKESLSKFIIVAVVYIVLGTFIRALPFHLIHTLRWSDDQLSVLQGTWGSLVSVMVILIGGIITDRYGAQRSQRVVMISISAFLILFGSLGFLWFHKVVSASGIIIYGLADPLFSVTSVPILMALCLKKVEGSQFTAYMAIVNLCDVFGAYISGWAMTYFTGPVVGVLCGTVMILAFIGSTYKRGFAGIKI